MAQYKVTLTAEEEKALLTNMISIQEWVSNAVHNKARQVIDTIVDEFAKGKLELETEFTEAEKTKIKEAKGERLFADPKSFPMEVKRIIIKRAKVKTAQEKNEEFEEAHK